MLQTAVRDKLLKQFENWLDDLLARETPVDDVTEVLAAALAQPDGSYRTRPDENQNANNDLYSMWSAITVLTQEIKLQGRTFNRLNDQMAPLAGLNDAIDRLTAMTASSQKDSGRVALDVHEIRRQQEKNLKIEAREAARREMVQQLIDIRTRLRIGIDSVKAGFEQLDRYRQSRWRYRLFKKKSAATRHMFEVVASLEKGYRMSLAQIEETMQALGVEEIPCKGQLFNPQLMSVVEVEINSALADGTVVELYRDGYMIDGEVLQPALVKVATTI